MDLMALHLVHLVEGFAGSVLEVGKGESCLLAGIVMRVGLVLVKTVVGLVEGTLLSQRLLNRHRLLVDPRGVALVAEVEEAVGQAQDVRE